MDYIYKKDATSEIKIYIKDEIVEKRVTSLLHYGIYERELQWLTELKNWDRTPNIISTIYDKKQFVMTYVGEEITRDNLPKDYENQLYDILETLKIYSCSHNDLRPNNLLVKDNIIHLIDFQWATCIGAPLDSTWPKGLGDEWRASENILDDAISINKIIQTYKNLQ